MKPQTKRQEGNRLGNSESKVSSGDPSSHERFYDYYAKVSQSNESLQRFASIYNCVLRIVQRNRSLAEALEIADIGCGAGTQCLIWAKSGHYVHGLDVNEPLVELARERAAQAGYSIDFRVGSAVQLPWPDNSMNVCLVLELLEHVAEWKPCLNEFVRILRPGGVLVLTTTNWLCPLQQEFNLPLYSWYPAPLKRYYERLSMTTHPELANFAKYPAVNWFSFYSLRAVLRSRGFQCLDRFDSMDPSNHGNLVKWTLYSVRTIPIFRWLAHVATPGTIVVGVKR